MSHGVNAAVNRARTAKVRHGGANFVLCRFDHLINKFRNPFSFCGAYRNDRNTERGAHRHNVHRAAVCAYFVHHIQRNDGGNVHFKQLQRQIKVSFDIRRVNNVYDSVGLFIHYKIAGNDFFLRIRT